MEHCDESFVREFQPTTIARVYAKWLASSCFFNENSPQLFWFTGSQYSFNLLLFILSAELAGAIHRGGFGRITIIQKLFSMLRIWPAVYLSAASPETDSPYSICICSIQFPFGDWLTQCFPIHRNHQIIYLVIKRQIMEKKINPNLNFVRPEHYNQMLELFVREQERKKEEILSM